MQRYRGVIFAAGILLALLGLIMMAASMGSADYTTRMFGGIFFSFGCVTMAAMFYLGAREIHARNEQIAQPAQHPRERCFVCGAAKARMRCTEHQVRLCFACIESHHLPVCRYIPVSQTRAQLERSSPATRGEAISRS